jgi:hypothetical protein
VFTLVVPFHRDAGRLERVFALAEEAKRHGIGQILFCHNGVPLDEATQEALTRRLPLHAALLHTDGRGIGAGYRLGIANATGEYVVLSASDLPFGFTDVDAFQALDARPRLAIGSKAHPQSRLAGWGAARSLASFGFYALRRLLLGPTPKDSQGTILVETSLARSVLAEVEADDYFFSLEIVTMCARRGQTVPVELPITLEAHDGASSVNLVSDSLKMARNTWRLRRRLR